MPDALPTHRSRSSPPSGYASIARPGRRKVKSCRGPGERVAKVTCVVIVLSPGSASLAAPCASWAIGFGSIGSMVTPRALRAKEVEPAFAGPSRRLLPRAKTVLPTRMHVTPELYERMIGLEAEPRRVEPRTHEGAHHQGAEIRAPMIGRESTILTREALAFLADLHRHFDRTRQDLLHRRAQRQARIDRGDMLDFLPETASVREGSWKIGPLPADLQDRRVEITGPTDRKMMINALNSGAQVFMADFEDANTPAWRNLVEGHVNLLAA